jgi:carboxyl-terminal processing protease
MQEPFQTPINKKLVSKWALILAIGMYLGFLFSQSRFTLLLDPDMRKSINKFWQILYYIKQDYVDNVNMQSLTDVAINQLINQLDPHSSYITAQAQGLLNAELEGKFTGIGLEFCLLQDTIYVIDPVVGGPAHRAGIQAGDQIIRVDGQIWAGKNMALPYILENLRGPQGSQVTLSIQRANATQMLDFTLNRDTIHTYAVNVAYMVNQEVGYIKLSRFTNHTYEEFMAATTKLQEQGMQKLLLDLQNNPGGYLDQAVKIIEHLLAPNKLILYTQGKNPKYNTQYYAKGTNHLAHIPIIVLINERSASAAEILAGALQDHDRALLVGRCSFGKGLIQRPIPLVDGSQLRLTVSRYYTPSGRFIQKPYLPQSTTNQLPLSMPYQQTQGDPVAGKQLINHKVGYKTAAGRTVYGEMGGIMPDSLVPLETLPGDTYVGQLLENYVLQQYAIDYANLHKARLTNMHYANYYTNFDVTEAMLATLYTKGQSAGITRPKQFARQSQQEIKFLVKAYIARTIWKAEGFYPLLNQLDPIFRQAIHLFDQAEALLKITSPSS